MPLIPDKGIVSLIGVGLYFVVLFIAILIASYSIRKKIDTIESPNILFYFLAILFLTFRVAWFCVQASLSVYPPVQDDADDGWGRTDTTFILNRLSLCWFFAAISVILFNWARVVDVAEYMTSTLNTHLHKIFLVLNIIVSISIVITIIVYMTESQGTREGNPFYDSGVLLLGVVNFLFMAAFIIYGLRLYLLTSEITKHKMIKVLMLAGVFLCCFGLRVTLLLYRPITGKKIYNSAFYTLCYFIPELTPLVVQIGFQSKHMLSQLEERKHDSLMKHDPSKNDGCCYCCSTEHHDDL